MVVRSLTTVTFEQGGEDTNHKGGVFLKRSVNVNT